MIMITYPTSLDGEGGGLWPAPRAALAITDVGDHEGSSDARPMRGWVETHRRCVTLWLDHGEVAASLAWWTMDRLRDTGCRIHQAARRMDSTDITDSHDYDTGRGMRCIGMKCIGMKCIGMKCIGTVGV